MRHETSVKPSKTESTHIQFVIRDKHETELNYTAFSLSYAKRLHENNHVKRNLVMI
jgi:hypothetical protein